MNKRRDRMGVLFRKVSRWVVRELVDGMEKGGNENGWSVIVWDSE